MLNTKQERTLLLIVIAAGTLALFFKLGDRSLENKDRLLYAEVVRELVQSGDWITLRHNGETYLHKPPLFFWLAAVPAHIYGAVTPFIARLPSAVSATLGVVAIFFLGKQIYGSAVAGFLSGLVLLSCYEYSWHARTAQTDMLLCFFIILSLSLFYKSYNTQQDGKRLLYFLLSCASVGSGVMVKGPTGFIIPVLTAAGFLAYKRDFRAFYRPQYLLGAIVLAAVVLPWSIILCNRLGGISATLTELQGTDIFTRSQPFYFYLVEVPKRFFPWSVFLPATSLFFLKKARDDRFFPLIWFGVMLVILSIPGCKNARYMVPAYPALALMVGGMWNGVLNAKTNKNKYEKTPSTRQETWLRVSIIVSLIILLIIILAATVFFSFRYQYLFAITLCTCITFLCAITLLYYRKRAKIHLWSFAVITAFYILVQLIHVHAITVEDPRHSPGRDLARDVSERVKEDELLAYNLPARYLDPLNFYMNRVLPVLKDQDDVLMALKPGDPTYLIMQMSDVQSLDPDLKAKMKYDKEVFYKDKRLIIVSPNR